MTQLILGLVLFLGIHSAAIVAPAGRERAAARLGEWGWKGLYAAVSLIGLVLIVRGYGAARLDPTWLYVPPGWLRHLGMLLLVPVFPLLLAAYLPGRIRARLRHPMLVAVKAWALAHLLMNGALADVVLFGGFLAWAVADRVSLRRRPARPSPSLPASAWNDAIAVVAGLGLYLAFVAWLHAWLIGVPVVA
ncbi:MAG: NnrU family protein [Halofilum sp. (in: g-proteobacteria)]|nr:NnrU family protein [Halofilum sp. (in: g-proteobacteria)]